MSDIHFSPNPEMEVLMFGSKVKVSENAAGAENSIIFDWRSPTGTVREGMEVGKLDFRKRISLRP